MNRLLMLRRAMMSAGAAIKKFVVMSATEIVSFVTNLVMPTKITCEFSPVQSGTGDPSPSNVRPISGWTGCEITKVGANYYNPNCEIGVQYDTTPKSADVGKLIPGVWQNNLAYYSPNYITLTKTLTGFKYTTSDSRYRVGYIFKVKPGMPLRVTFLSTEGCNLCFYEKNWNAFARQSGWNNAQTKTVVVPDGAYYCEIVFGGSANTEVTFDNINISVSGGTEYSEYEVPQIVSVNWQSEAGTVYGGTLTINEDGTGTLVQNCNGVVYNGSEDWSKYGSGSASSFAMRVAITNFVNRDGEIKSDYLKPISKNATWGNEDNWISWANPNVITTGIQSITDVASWKAYLAQHPLTVVYSLAAPVTYNLTASQVNSIIGTNNIWHDMNGGITVEYYKKQ